MTEIFFSFRNTYTNTHTGLLLFLRHRKKTTQSANSSLQRGKEHFMYDILIDVSVKHCPLDQVTLSEKQRLGQNSTRVLAEGP